MKKIIISIFILLEVCYQIAKARFNHDVHNLHDWEIDR